MNYNVPGGRISPSVSEADLRSPIELLKAEVSTFMPQVISYIVFWGSCFNAVNYLEFYFSV